MNKIQEKYIKDASTLIKHSASTKLHKDVVAVTKLPSQVARSILPSFTTIQDSFRNLVSGLGGSQAKSTYTTYRTNFCMTDQLLYSLYETHGLSRKIAEVIPKDATKNDITVNNDTDNVLKNKWDKIKAIKAIRQADIYRRHFGGSIIYVNIDDGGELSDPVNFNSIKEVKGLKVYSRTDTFFTNVHFSDEITSDNYGQPEFYTIIPKYTTPFNIHHTRVIEFKGLEMPSHLDNGYRYYWGQSIVEPIWNSLKKVGAAIENVDQLLYEMTISIYKIKGLADLICSGDWDTIKKIIDQAQESKSTIRAMLLDAEGHDYTRDSLSFPGVKDVIELLFKLLSGESSIPTIRLFGDQNGGLNNNGEGVLSGYYDEVKDHQKNEITEQSQKIIDLINLSKEVGNKKVIDPIVEYNSPYQLTEEQELKNRETQMKIDTGYNAINAVSSQEIRELRFENDYSASMNVSELDSYQETLLIEGDDEDE